ncbi:MAG: exo-alpha-sialidase, partial [Clostridia bacterium]|nr:exo-alpha-sialidase [Clostridia bacterium]
FPAYDWVNPDRYVLRFSSDGGETFVDKPAAKKPDNQVFDETMVYETKEGYLRLLARTNRGFYATSLSTDGGETWSETGEYEKAPSTRFFIARLKSGRLVYVRNISDTERTGMKVMLSEDDGKTWNAGLALDVRPGVSYPDLAEGEDGRLYIVHDCERDNRAHLDRSTWRSGAAKEILLSSVTEEDILRGEIGEGSYVARVISKAGIDVVEK